MVTASLEVKSVTLDTIVKFVPKKNVQFGNVKKDILKPATFIEITETANSQHIAIINMKIPMKVLRTMRKFSS